MLIQWKDELVMMICVVWLVGIVFCCCYSGATTRQGGLGCGVHEIGRTVGERGGEKRRAGGLGIDEMR